jgi:hypothetical protein
MKNRKAQDFKSLLGFDQHGHFHFNDIWLDTNTFVTALK